MNKCNATRDKAITMTGDFLAREMTIDRMRVCLSSYSPALANIPPHSTIKCTFLPRTHVYITTYEMHRREDDLEVYAFAFPYPIGTI